MKKVKKILLDGKEVAISFLNIKAEVKALDESTGIVEAYVSIFGNVDAAGEIVEKGAFTESLKRKMPKVVHSHDWEQPIGTVLEAREDSKGLYVKMQLVLEVQRAKDDYELMKAGAIDEFSIGYGVDEATVDEKGIRHLIKLNLYEVSPVLVGCNDATELLSVKSAEKKEESDEVIEEKEIVEEKIEEKEIKGAVAEVLNEEEQRELKWEKYGEVSEIFNAFWDVYFQSEVTVEQFDALLTETIGLLQGLVGQTGVDDEEKSKIVGLLKKSVDKGKKEFKEGRTLSEQNRNKIKEAMDGMNEMLGAADNIKKCVGDCNQTLEALLTATEVPTVSDGKSKVEQHDMRVKKIILRDAREGVKHINKVLFTLKRI